MSRNSIFSILVYKLTKRPTTFVGTAVWTTAVVGAIALGVWFLHALFERILSTPHTIAGVTITPYGHSMESLLTHHFDSISVSIDGTEIKVANPNLDITLLGTRNVQLQVDSVIAFVQLPPQMPHPKTHRKIQSLPPYPRT